MKSDSSMFYGNLRFDLDKRLKLFNTYGLDSITLSYAIISPGKVKLSASDNPLVVDYSIDGDLLQINFSDGINDYSREN